MNPTIEKKVQAYESLRNTQEALLNKGDELTADDVVNIQQNNAALEKAHGEIVALQAAEAGLGKHTAFVNTAVMPAPHAAAAHIAPNVGAGTYATGVTVLGTVPDGFMQIDGNGSRIKIEDVADHDFGKEAFNVCGTPEYARAYRKYLSKGLGGLTNSEQFTLQEGVDTSGGFLAPAEILNQIIAKKPTPTRIANYVQQFNTSRDTLAIPKVVYGTDDLYTTGMRVTWTGEIPTSSTAHLVTDPVFGAVKVPVYTAMMSIPVTRDLLEDSMVDLEGWLSMKFSETIELLKDNMILNGTGLGQPLGILANPGGAGQPAVVTMGNPITADGVLKVAYAVPEQYDENAKWIFNKTSTALAISQLKDSQNRYLYGMGYQDSGLAVPLKGRALAGYDVLWSGFAPGVGANNYPVVFGDLTGYALVNRVGFSIQVLREIAALSNQVVLVGRVRFGGQVVQDWALKVGQQA